jgi:hypothetical protein
MAHNRPSAAAPHLDFTRFRSVPYRVSFILPCADASVTVLGNWRIYSAALFSRR